MATTQRGTDPAGGPAPGPQPSRRRWRWLVPLVVVVWVLVVGTLLFGGPTFGKLAMNDLDGHTYTVTAVHMDGFTSVDGSSAPMISFRDGWARWTSGCNEATSAYRVTWTTLELTGQSASTLMECSEPGTGPAYALGRMLHDQPSVRLQDENRLVLEGVGGSTDLVESA